MKSYTDWYIKGLERDRKMAFILKEAVLIKYPELRDRISLVFYSGRLSLLTMEDWEKQKEVENYASKLLSEKIDISVTAAYELYIEHLKTSRYYE